VDKNKLHKLAEALRQVAKNVDKSKKEKCASLLVAASGLDILNRKIGAGTL